MTEMLCENPHLSLEEIENRFIEMEKRWMIDITVMMREYFMYVLLTVYKIAHFAISVGAGDLYQIDFYSTFVVKCVLWPEKCEDYEASAVRSYYADPIGWVKEKGIKHARMKRVGVIQHVFVIDIPKSKKIYVVPVRKLSIVLRMISDRERYGELDTKRYERYIFTESDFSQYIKEADAGAVLYF
jgi:hypothetical protein